MNYNLNPEMQASGNISQSTKFDLNCVDYNLPGNKQPSAALDTRAVWFNTE